MPHPEIRVIRLSSRAYRDMRITTHCCLVARAFGATAIYLSNENDTSIPKTVNEINERFGGNFQVLPAPNPSKIIKQLKEEGFTILHLTMYGEKPDTIIPKIRKNKKIAIIIGADKVPAAIYHAADYNISVTRQPHSEVGALAVVMHEIMEGGEEELQFQNNKLQVIPTPKGKNVKRLTH